MRFAKISLVCICLLGLTLPAWSQKVEQPAERGIPGFLDPRSGEFKPMVIAPAEESVLLAPTTGEFKVTIAVTIKSMIPLTDPVQCFFSTSVFDTGSSRFVDDTMIVAATGTGATRTCTLNMFYSWPLSSPTTDMVNLNIFAGAPTFTGGAATTLPIRTNSQSLGSIKVPASGTATSETASVTL